MHVHVAAMSIVLIENDTNAGWFDMCYHNRCMNELNGIYLPVVRRSVNASWHSINPKHCICQSMQAKYRKQLRTALACMLKYSCMDPGEVLKCNFTYIILLLLNSFSLLILRKQRVKFFCKRYTERSQRWKWITCRFWISKPFNTIVTESEVVSLQVAVAVFPDLPAMHRSMFW